MNRQTKKSDKNFLEKLMYEDIDFDIELIFRTKLLKYDYYLLLKTALEKYDCEYYSIIIYPIVKYDLFDCFEYLIKNDYPLQNDVLIYIIKYNKLPFFEYFINNYKYHYDLNYYCFYYAIKNNNEIIFNKLLEMNCSYDCRVLTYSLRKQKINMLNSLIKDSKKKYKFILLLKFYFKKFKKNKIYTEQKYLKN